MCADDDVTVTHDLVNAESVRKIILPAKDLQRKSTEGFECLINSPIMQVLKLKLFQKAFWSSHILSRAISIVDLKTKQSHQGPLWYAVNGCWTRRERFNSLSPSKGLWQLLFKAST